MQAPPHLRKRLQPAHAACDTGYQCLEQEWSGSPCGALQEKRSTRKPQDKGSSLGRRGQCMCSTLQRPRLPSVELKRGVGNWGLCSLKSAVLKCHQFLGVAVTLGRQLPCS